MGCALVLVRAKHAPLKGYQLIQERIALVVPDDRRVFPESLDQSEGGLDSNNCSLGATETLQRAHVAHKAHGACAAREEADPGDARLEVPSRLHICTTQKMVPYPLEARNADVAYIKTVFARHGGSKAMRKCV